MTLYNYFQFAKTAMTIGLLVAAGVLLWPGALATVANFSLFGVSIAAYVGSNVLYQAGAVAALTFVGLHTLGIAMDIVGGFFSLLKSCCFSSSSSAQEDYDSTHRHRREPPVRPQNSYQTLLNAIPPAHEQSVGQTQQPPPSHHPIYQPSPQSGYQPLYPQLDGYDYQKSPETYGGYPKLS